jgi:hypothetical protein
MAPTGDCTVCATRVHHLNHYSSLSLLHVLPLHSSRRRRRLRRRFGRLGSHLSLHALYLGGHELQGRVLLLDFLLGLADLTVDEVQALAYVLLGLIRLDGVEQGANQLEDFLVGETLELLEMVGWRIDWVSTLVRVSHRSK